MSLANLLRAFRPSRPANLPGAILLPRHVADRDVGQASWPKCARCRRAVDAYGIERQTDVLIEVWARCTGVRIDPQTGRAVHGSFPIHPTLQSSSTILKGPGWSPNRYTDIVRRLAFFDPRGDRQWTQDLTQDGVGKRWGAG